MLTWYDIGNGWRNVYLLGSGVTALALATLCVLHPALFGRRKSAAALAGVACTPLVQTLWMLLLALAWPDAPQKLCVFGLPALSALYLLLALISRRKRLGAAARTALSWVKQKAHMGRAALVCATLVFALGCLLLPVFVRVSTNNANGHSDIGEYMGLALRYCENRDFGELLSKDDPEGHFRGHSHFPSYELYMSYGLMHTSGQIGYPYDKPAFTGLGLLTFYFLAGFFALALQFTRGNWRWSLLSVLLLNLVPELELPILGSTRDLFRFVGLCAALLYLYSLRPTGGIRSLLGKGAGMLTVCFAAMSTHVVSFVVLPFMVVGWVALCWFESLLARRGGSGRTLGKAVLLALCGAAGTVIAFVGNLQCYAKWGEMSPFRLMTTYTGAPWYEMYAKGEYRIEEASTTIGFWQNRAGVFQQHATPLGVLGFWLAALTVIGAVIWLIAVRRNRAELEPVRVERLSAPLFAALTVLMTLAPMTGLLDTKIYSFSGAFAALPRYVVQWFIFCCFPPCALCAALESRVWRPELKRWSAVACAALCLVVFARGVSQSGYDTSVYRYTRDTMEDETLLLDNAFRARYETLMKLAAAVPEDEAFLVTEVGDQYALRAKGYALTSNAWVDLMVTSVDDLPSELAKRKVAVIATDKDFWDTRYFALSELSEYLSSLPADQIVEDDVMRFYLIDPALKAALAKE